MINNEEKSRKRSNRLIILLSGACLAIVGLTTWWGLDTPYAQQRKIERLYNELFPYIEKFDGDSLYISIKDRAIFSELMGQSNPWDYRVNPRVYSQRLTQILDSLKQNELEDSLKENENIR